MKTLLTIFFSINTLLGFSQLNETEPHKIDTVTFVVKVELENATKEGLYMNGAVLNMKYEEVKRLDGKTIEVIGIATTVKGLKNSPKEYDDEGYEIVKQGREEDTHHIQIIEYRIIKD